MSDEIDTASWIIPAGFLGFAGVVFTFAGAFKFWRGDEDARIVLALALVAVALSGLAQWKIHRRLRLLRIKERLRGRAWPPTVPENRTVRM